MEKLQPQLRFPEFIGEWEEKKLGTVFSIFNGYAFPSKASEIEGVIWVKIADVGIQEMKYKNLSFLPSSYLATHKKFVLKKGDYVVALTRPILNGKLKIAQINDFFDGALLNQRVGKIYSKNSHAFVFSLLQRDELIKSIENSIAGSDPPNLSPNEINPILVHIPHLPEQTKIATFLTAVDEKLTALKQKKTLLEQYKKGVMQQIFSQELRFKDDTSTSLSTGSGNDYANWEEKKLGDVVKYYDGTHQTPTYVENGVPFYSVEHLTANQFSKSKYISEEVFEKENKRIKLEKGDILMTRIGDIGTARLIDWDVNASFYVSLALIKQNSKYNSSFLNQYISSGNFQKELWSKTIHVAFPKKINLGEIGNCKVLFPSIEEQTKIANFLSAIDEKINHCQGQIDQTTIWKKGLLQQLFV
jgi:type I restriction enzyme S subunit